MANSGEEKVIRVHMNVVPRITQPTELRGRTDKVGDDLGGE